MADVALLVVEDFERTKQCRGGGGRGSKQELLQFLAPFTVSDAGRLAGQVDNHLKEMGRAAQPRSSLGLAALDGLFSA